MKVNSRMRFLMGRVSTRAVNVSMRESFSTANGMAKGQLNTRMDLYIPVIFRIKSKTGLVRP